MKIAIFGGRFDPPHLGHYWVVRQVLDFRPDIDKVLFVPAAKHQWKPTRATPSQRIEMLGMMKEPGLEVSDIEVIRGGVSYSIDTIRKVKEQTSAEIFWIVGSDILSEFHRWEKADELIKEVKFLIFPRDPYRLPGTIPAGFEVIRDTKMITSNISSTIIRERIKQGLSINNFLPKSIEDYINKKNLYR